VTRYILKRFRSSILTLFIVVTLTFFLIRAIPGGPFTDEKAIPPEVMEKVLERYHMNDPLYKQYFDYLKNLLKFDLGPSFRYAGRTVNEIIGESFPVSAFIGALAILISLAVGIPIGIISALRRGKWQDNAVMLLATLGVTVPNFVIATFLIYVFALKLGVVTVGLWEGVSTSILPAVTLAGYPTAFISRLVRSSMLEVIQQDYIRTARSKGLTERVVIYIHALKNTLIPLLTYLGPLTAGILTGSFVVEQVFGVPGLGTHFVTSIQNRDYTMIIGVTVFYSTFLVIINFLIDICYGFIDPRIKLDS
jgi:oligopeptide transport system permease protein